MSPRTAVLDGPGFTVSLTEREVAGPTDSILERLEGWYGGAGVSGDNPKRPLGHGLFVAPSTREGRPMTLGGVLVFPTGAERDLAQRLLSGVLWDGELGRLTVRDAAGLELSAEVKLDGTIKAAELGPRAVRFEVPLLAPDPFLVAEEQVVSLYPAGVGEGLVWPLFSGAPTALAAVPVWAGRTAASNAPDGTTTTSMSGQAWLASDHHPLAVGRTHRQRVWLKADRGNSNAALRTSYLDANLNYIAGDYHVWPKPVATDYTLFEAELNPPPNAARIKWDFIPNHVDGTVRDAIYGLRVELHSRPVALTYGNSAPTSNAVVRNGGNATAWPRIAVRGEFPGGFTLSAGLNAVTYPAPTYPQDPVLVDMATGSITVDGRDVTYRASRRDWFSIPAAGALKPRLTALAPSSGWADVIYCDTYM